MALNRLRNPCSRLEDLFSLVSVEARWMLSSNLVWRRAAVEFAFVSSSSNSSTASSSSMSSEIVKIKK